MTKILKEVSFCRNLPSKSSFCYLFQIKRTKLMKVILLDTKMFSTCILLHDCGNSSNRYLSFLSTSPAFSNGRCTCLWFYDSLLSPVRLINLSTPLNRVNSHWVFVLLFLLLQRWREMLSNISAWCPDEPLTFAVLCSQNHGPQILSCSYLSNYLVSICLSLY